MITQKPLRWIARILVFFLVLLLFVALVALHYSKFELNPNGVHKNLLVPLGGSYAKVAVYGGSGDAARLPGFLDGPVARPLAGGGWSATWFCEDRVQQQQVQAPLLAIDCAGKRSVFPLASSASAPVADVLPMPAKVAVLSDIEGNLTFLDGALGKLGVSDGAATWTYGDGHLVVVGDAVDRGREVFAVLWRLYALAQQAQRAGGGVHLVLGNHEQYILRGNTTRANLEHIYALQQMGGPQQAFAADTVIGQWLRAQPVILQMGDVLFTHGGISRETADSGLSVQQLNEAMRAYWSGTPASAKALDAVIGKRGLTQYRGYFEDDGGVAVSADVEQVLKRFGASTIVVGHTLVDKVTMLHNGRVIGVDVNTNRAQDEALVFEGGKPRVAAVVDRGLPPEENGRGRLRQLELTDARDWQALGSTLKRSYELSRLPHPY